MKPKIENYRLEVRALAAEDGGGFLATYPDLPGCMSDGETPEEAVLNAREALVDWMAARRALKLPIPEPQPEASGKFLVRLPKSLHAALLDRASHEGVSANTLLVSLVAEGIGYTRSTRTKRQT